MDIKKFDTKVQHLKYKVLREVARLAWQDKLLENVMNIPEMIIPGKIPTMRCCVYKERAIIGERVKLAMGLDNGNPNVIQVIDIACDECPVGGYEVQMHAADASLTDVWTRADSARFLSMLITSLISTRQNVKNAERVREFARTPLSLTIKDRARTPAK